jgi:selenocysteine lyase/cysteine desulfurase
MTSLPTKPPLDPALFDNPDDVLWLMHCSEGPVPRASARALIDFLPRETRPWSLRWREDFQAIPKRTRAAAARVLGAEARDITLTPTTSSGLVTIAQTFPWHRDGRQQGGEIVLPRGEFPSNIWPWKALAARGVALREVALWDGHEAGAKAWQSAPPTAGIDPEACLLAALGPRTQVLAVSWVRFQDGIVLDLPRLAKGCAAKRVALVVDGIQGAGTLVPSLDGVSAFATGGHKGLLAPQGLGILWTDPTFRQELVPAGSWLSVEQSTDFSRHSTDPDRDWSCLL